MAYQDGSALPHGDGEDEDEEYHVPAIGARSQGGIAQHIDEEGDDHLRTAVADFLAGSGQAYLQQILQLYPRERAEKPKGEGWYMLTKEKDEEQHHTGPTGDAGRDGRPLYTQSRHTELTENQRVVA